MTHTRFVILIEFAWKLVPKSSGICLVDCHVTRVEVANLSKPGFQLDVIETDAKSGKGSQFSSTAMIRDLVDNETAFFASNF